MSKSVFPLFLFCLCAGCASTSATHWPVGDAQHFEIMETTHGYALGSCGIYKGGIQSVAEFTLSGQHAIYADGQFSIKTIGSFPGQFAAHYSGTIAVDWKNRTLTIDLRAWTLANPNRKQSRLNGTYRFDEQKAPVSSEPASPGHHSS
ncbi:MAG TPA: hypothetical protein VHD32_03020 [Candidatus Didemnitutus sp.]|nr:hypothetical protein [Candidatus Didemnitutus sp.]